MAQKSKHYQESSLKLVSEAKFLNQF